MPTPTYTPLATITLGSSASSVTFSSIPATYRDLVLTYQFSSTTGAVGLLTRFNGITSSIYSRVFMLGFPTTSTLSGSSTSTSFETLVLQSNNDTQISKLDIMDYSATDKHKTVLRRQDQGGVFVLADALRWANTSAITSISLTIGSGTISAGSTFNLYGIAS